MSANSTPPNDPSAEDEPVDWNDLFASGIESQADDDPLLLELGMEETAINGARISWHLWAPCEDIEARQASYLLAGIDPYTLTKAQPANQLRRARALQYAEMLADVAANHKQMRASFQGWLDWMDSVVNQPVHAGYRWAAQRAAQVADQNLPDNVAERDHRRGVPTSEMAQFLGGIANRSTEQWKKLLSKSPPYLDDCIVHRGLPGMRGRVQTTWHPVSVFSVLVRRKTCTLVEAAHRFRLAPLKDFREEWEDLQPRNE